MTRPNNPAISPTAQKARDLFAGYLREEQDVSPATLRNYLSDLRQFIAWFEEHAGGQFRLADATEYGVDGVTPHTFRHTVATRLVRDPNVDLATAATFLGHSRLDITARYSRPSEEDLAQVAERLG